MAGRRFGFGTAALACWLVVGAGAQGGSGACVCATSRETNGWCPVHEFGYVGGVRVTSSALYGLIDAHGHQLDLSTFTCPSCRKAIATNGFCDEHHLGFVDGLAYFSLLTYELGKGEIRSRSSITCPVCLLNSETHGWCDKSRVGMVGQVAIKDRLEFDRTVKALEIFIAANKAANRCDSCAAAIITDSECPVHRIRYKDGKPLPQAPSSTVPAAAGS